MKQLFSIANVVDGSSACCCAWQTATGNFIAVNGPDNVVRIFDRTGELVDDIALPGECTALQWDSEGDLLVIINSRSNAISLWNANTQRSSQIDSTVGLRGSASQDALTFATWSPKSSLLAVGNHKGNLLLYNHQTSRKTPVVGKHTKRITCGAFNDSDILALGSDDQTITVSDNTGDTLHSFVCGGTPSKILFSEMKESGSRGGSGAERAEGIGVEGKGTVSAVVDNRTLMLMNLRDVENPINLQFQDNYGHIADYAWYGDGYIMIGFSTGYIIGISTHLSEIGQEIFCLRDFKTSLVALSVNEIFGKIITLGDASVKLRELPNPQEVFAITELDDAEKGLASAITSFDGQLLAVCTRGGSLHVYLTRLPTLGASYLTRIAALSSLSEVTVTNEIQHEKAIVFPVDIEPSFVGVGPFHVCVGANSRAWFYNVQPHGVELVRDKEYIGTVDTVKLNGDYAAALTGGKVFLHSIEGSESDDRDTRVLPDADSAPGSHVTCITMTPDFLVFGTTSGHVQYFFFEDWKIISEFKHTSAIRNVVAEPAGTRIVMFDQKQDCLLYNPVNDSTLAIPDIRGSISGALWDIFPHDQDSFVIYDSEKMYSCIYYRDTIEGASVHVVCSTRMPQSQQAPLLVYNGQLTCLATNAKTNTFPLDSHVIDGRVSERTAGELDKLLNKCIALKKWSSAWSICDHLRNKDQWKKLAMAAMWHLDVDFAMRVFRQVSDVGMVWSLESLLQVDDRNLLAGHIAMFLDKFDLAEKLYLDSGEPTAALDLRRDLLHWDKALQLAERLAPGQIPFISKEYAQQLEFTANYTDALRHYEQGQIAEGESAEIEANNDVCQAGIARMSIRLGQIPRGVDIAMRSSERTLKKDCAMILETMKQLNEAAKLYESGNFFDRAAAVCVRSRNWLKVAELLPKVNSPKIHVQYAKAMEAEKRYKAAVEAYKAAKDYDNVVRLLLEQMNAPEEAVEVVRQSKSIEGAKLVAKHFLKQNDYGSAIQFLVLSQCNADAYRLAEQHDKVEIYAEVIGTQGTHDEYTKMAQYFESKKRLKLAGKYYFYSEQYERALSHLMSCGEDHEALRLAIECVGAALNGELTHRLVDYLMGETDGIPKDARYLFRLYMALSMFREASKVALIIAREEQNSGKYRDARDMLFGMYQELKNQAIKIPKEMDSSLMLIHSYMIAKLHIKRNDHVRAARLLSRVAANISRFPAHTVPILTSTVIECHRAGLRASAFKYAAILLRPEYKAKIDDKYRKKIETIVRKPDKSEIEEPTTPCPQCAAPLVESELMCTSCRNTVEYCIASGRHILREDFAQCPACSFPCNYTDFCAIMSATSDKCPLCQAAVNVATVARPSYEEYVQAQEQIGHATQTARSEASVAE